MALTTLATLRLSAVEKRSLNFGASVMRILGGDTVPGDPLTFAAWRPLAYPDTYVMERPIPNGTAEGCSNLRYSKRRVLTPSGVDNLDLHGSLVDDFGQTLNLARLTGLVISSVTGSFTLSREANGAPIFLDVDNAITVSDGGIFAFIGHREGGHVVVTAGTADLLTITAGGSGCTYDIHIIGASA